MYQISNEKFGLFVTELRKEKNLTQKDLAEKLYVSDKTVSKWERGLSMPNVVLLIPIADTVEIFSKCGKENCFGRTIVEEITGLKPSGASKLIKLLVDSEVIVPVTGHGKGKYRFQ